MRNIVILGAGFGGLKAALTLEKKMKRAGLGKSFAVVLVDRNDFHTYTPTLYEAATTPHDLANNIALKDLVTFPIPDIVAGTSIEFIKGEIDSLDMERGCVHLKSSVCVPYHYLLVALGSESSDFGIPGLKQFGLPLKHFEDAVNIRERLALLVEEKKGAELRIMVGGAGSTGVETAGEIANAFKRHPLARVRARVVIVEGAPTILPGFDSRIVSRVARRLNRLGVNVETNEKIKEVKESELLLASGRTLEFDLFIWTGGVAAPAILKLMPVKHEARGKMEVENRMECMPEPNLKVHGRIFGIGDSVCFTDPATGRPVVGVARAAISQGKIAAENIFECLLEEEKPGYKPRSHAYQPMQYPYILPAGGKWAAAKIGPVIISGLAGWLLKGLVELNYLTSILPKFKAVRLWLKGFFIFIRNDRLG